MGENGRVNDWDKITAEVNVLDQQLEELWSLKEAALPWVVSLIASALAIVHSILTYLRVGDGNQFRETLFLSSAQLVALLFALSTITSACKNFRANADSIPSAAQRAFSRALPALPVDQRRAHARFMAFCRGNTMGIEIQG